MPSGRVADPARAAADNQAVLAHVAEFGAAAELTAFQVARALGWICNQPRSLPYVNSNRAKRALDRLEQAGQVAHVDRPKDGGRGWKRTWHAAPQTPAAPAPKA